VAAYRKSTLAAQAPGYAETITRWSGQTMGGGRIPAFMGLAQRTGGVYLEVRLEQVLANVAQTAIDVVDGEPREVTTYTALDVPNYRCTTMHFNDGRQPVPVTPWVGPRYQPVQNTEALAIGQEIVDEGRGRLVAVGAYGDPVGSKTYAALALDGMTVDGQAPVDLFLTITNAHDGMGGLSFRLAPIVVACTNETPLYFGKRHAIKPFLTRRHTKNVTLNLAAEARVALGLAGEYREAWQAAAKAALSIKMTENQAITYWRQVFSVPAEASDWTTRQALVAQAREDALVSLLAGPTCEVGRGTAWGAFNAVTEYVDHMAPVRSADEMARRQARIVAGETDAIKQAAWELVMA
jgi:phage/plasmid-like protein (TIGR03299 family)